MSFTAPKFTGVGRQLQTRVIAGDTLTFTAIKLGDGTMTTEPIAALTDLIHGIITLPVHEVRRNADYAEVTGVFQNAGLSSGFYWREIGIFAADPDYPNDRSHDILYCYQNAAELAEYIPSASSAVIEKIIRVACVVGDAENVTVGLASQAYAKAEDLQALEAQHSKDVERINNALDAVDPAKVTAKAAPADGDGVMIADSADGGKAKRLLWSNVKTALGKLFVPLARKINGKALSADVTLTASDVGAAASGHNHDTRYYTQTQIDTKMSNAGASTVSEHNSSTTAHSALFAAKQDKIKGKKGKYLGFTANDTVGEVDALASGGSRITLTFAADFAGQEWTLSGGNETYTGTVDSSLTASVSVLGINTTYTLSAVLSGTTYITEVTTKDYYTALAVTLEKFQSTITVTIDSGSTVTATLGSTVLTKTSTGTAVFTVGKAGTWVIKATKGNQTAEGTVSITASGQSKSLTLSYANVFGVMWDTSNSSTALTRLTPETDPYGLVTKSVTTEPKPAVGTGSGSSPFDDYLPWSGMKECNLDAAGTVTAWKGDSNFSKGFTYTMVYIPEFYFKYKGSGAKKYFYISDRAGNDFVKHPGSGKFVGKYVCTQDSSGSVSHIHSQFGGSPGTNITRATARILAKENGTKFHLYDFATYCAIVLLYAVEFADWDCQTKIGRGIVASSTAQSSNNGWYPDYHTGRAAGTDGETAVQYRWIENLWGNVYQWVDGFNADGTTAYYCTDPSKYADDTTTGYTKIGTLPASGWIKDLTVTDNGLLIPKTTGGSDSTYIPDYAYSSSGWRVLCVGGYWDSGSSAGLLYFNANYASSSSSSSVSARLLCEA